MIKKIMLYFLGLCIFVILTQEPSFYQNDEITSIGVSLSFSHQLEFNTTAQSIELLKSLFVYSIYQEFVKEELRSFKSITALLSKPFIKFWIVKEVIKFLSKQFLYLVVEIRKIYTPTVATLLKTTLLFVFLFYFKTHLKTYRFAPMVLRC